VFIAKSMYFYRCASKLATQSSPHKPIRKWRQIIFNFLIQVESGENLHQHKNSPFSNLL